LIIISNYKCKIYIAKPFKYAPCLANNINIQQAVLDNRANQLNPNHVRSGPGRPAGYRGAGTKLDLDNHANQLNPNNPVYAAGRVVDNTPLLGN